MRQLWPALRSAVLVVATGAAVSFCGTESATETRSDALAHIPQTAIPPDLRGRVELEDIGAEGQLESLKDGRLTFDEMEAALAGFVQCLAEEGIAFRQPPVIDEKGILHYEAAAGSTGAELSETHAMIEACEYQHTSILRRFWAWAQSPTEQERSETRRRLAICLRESGLEASEVPGDVELGRLLTQSPQVFDACARRAMAETGASGF